MTILPPLEKMRFLRLKHPIQKSNGLPNDILHSSFPRRRISSKNVKYFNLKKFAGAEGGGDKSCYWCH